MLLLISLEWRVEHNLGIHLKRSFTYKFWHSKITFSLMCKNLQPQINQWPIIVSSNDLVGKISLLKSKDNVSVYAKNIDKAEIHFVSLDINRKFLNCLCWGITFEIVFVDLLFASNLICLEFWATYFSNRLFHVTFSFVYISWFPTILWWCNCSTKTTFSS